MQNWRRIGVTLVVTVCLVGACRSPSHKSVRTYEYNEDPAPSERADETVGESPGEMVSPGGMVSPGEMIDE